MREKKTADDALEAQTSAVEKAQNAAEVATKDAKEANQTLNSDVFELGSEKLTLNKFKGVVENERKEHADLNKKHKEAATIDISTSSVPDATNILDKKSKELKDVTGPLMDTIEREKEALVRKHESEKKVETLSQKVFDDKMTFANTNFKEEQTVKTKREAEKKEYSLKLQ